MGRFYRKTSAVLHASAVALRLGRFSKPPLVRELEIPAGFGKRIVIVADLHADRDFTPREYIKGVVDLVNAIDGIDIVVMPGDFVGYRLEDVEWCAEELSNIEAPCVASLGNHDIMQGRRHVCDVLRAVGIPVLVNDAMEMAGVWIGGLDSCFNGTPDPVAMRASVPDDAAMIVLGHEPALADLHSECLHIAGHTHHGQIRLRWLPFRYLPPHSKPYVEGLHHLTENGTERWVYTTAGIGNTSLPIRIGCPPEIVVLNT